jgi:hypothetical protein
MDQQTAPARGHTPGKTVAVRLALFVIGMTVLMVVLKQLLG